MLAASCDDAGGEDTAGIIHRAVVAARASDAGGIERFPGELPEGLPAEPPLYPNADLIGSSRLLDPPAAGQGGEDAPRTALYFIVQDTEDGRERILDFYESALDGEPWRLDASASIEVLDRLEFSHADDADISGVVQIVPDEEDGRTSIFVSLQDAGAAVEAEPTFEPGDTLPLLRRFPEELPEYAGAIVTGTAYQRAADSENFLLVFITMNSAEDVLAFYREELEELGWTVQALEGSGETGLDLHDESEAIEARLMTGPFLEDERYVEVDLRLQVRAAPQPTEGEATATPEP